MTTTVVLRSFSQCTGVLTRQLQQVSIERAICPLAQKRLVATKADVDENIKKFKEGKFDKIADPEHLQHFRANQVQTTEDVPPMASTTLPHRVWSDYETDDVKITHKPPVGWVDKAAYAAVISMRESFDVVSGFKWGRRDDKRWIKRIVFLETVAAVPGMVAAMTRHFHSLRSLQRDYGWIHTLLEEAENERMHLMTALNMRKQTKLFRLGVLGVQGMFVPMFCLSYLISPRFCHRYVGYLEEEAVKTYTHCLEDIDSGLIQHWQTYAAPDVAKRYWKLPDDATMKEVILVIRADEAHHRNVNHTLASMKSTDYNPYKPGE